MNKILSLFFLSLSFLSPIAPMVAGLVFVLLGEDDAALCSMIGALAGVLPCWLFMELAFRFENRHIVFPRHSAE